MPCRVRSVSPLLTAWALGMDSKGVRRMIRTPFRVLWGGFIVGFPLGVLRGLGFNTRVACKGSAGHPDLERTLSGLGCRDTQSCANVLNRILVLDGAAGPVDCGARQTRQKVKMSKRSEADALCRTTTPSMSRSSTTLFLSLRTSKADWQKSSSAVHFSNTVDARTPA